MFSTFSSAAATPDVDPGTKTLEPSLSKPAPKVVSSSQSDPRDTGKLIELRPTATKAPQPMMLRELGRTLDLKSNSLKLGMTPPPKKPMTGKLGAVPKRQNVAKQTSAKVFMPAVSKRPAFGASQARPKAAGLYGKSTARGEDVEGRPYNFRDVVLDFASVGNTLGMESSGCFDWQGVRLCVRHLKDTLGLQVVGVLSESLIGSDSGSLDMCALPLDIRILCDSLEELPADDEDFSKPRAQLEAVVDEAYGRNCRFIVDGAVDEIAMSDNATRNEWLKGSLKSLLMQYVFNSSSQSFAFTNIDSPHP